MCFDFVCQKCAFKDRTHETHFTRNTAWGAGEQLTITANHHHEGAPLTVALMSNGTSGSCVARVTGRAAKFIENFLIQRVTKIN